jgi:hypothetical protein
MDVDNYKFINDFVDKLSTNELLKHTKEISQWKKLIGAISEFK